MTISQLGSTNGMAIAFPRTYYAMAAEGHFFKSFAKLHPKYRVPTVPILCQCLITPCWIWLRDLNQLTSLVVFSNMLFNVMVIIAVPVLRKKNAGCRKTLQGMGRHYRICNHCNLLPDDAQHTLRRSADLRYRTLQYLP